MNPSGMSLFDGGGSIHLNTSAVTPEEEEDIEDQQRRRRELQQDLENGLEDFMNDDDESYNESCRSISLSHPVLRSFKNKAGTSGLKDLQTELYQSSLDKAQEENGDKYNLYDFHKGRVTPEVNGHASRHLLHGYNGYESNEPQLHSSREHHNAEYQQDDHFKHLYQKFSQQSNEAETAISDHYVSKLQHQIELQQHKITSLETHNEKLSNELMATTASLMDAQHKLQTAKLNKESVQTAEVLHKAQQQRFQEDIDKLETDLVRERNKLSEKEKEYMKLECHFREVENLKDSLLNEKGSTINKLALNLEEAQKQLANNETPYLKQRISVLTIERNTAQIQVKEMAEKLETTVTQLVDSQNEVLRLRKDMLDLQSTIEQMAEDCESESFAEIKSRKSGRGDSSYTDKIFILKSELMKSITHKKLREDQIKGLEETLLQKEKMITSLKESEKKLRKEVETGKEKQMKVSAELKILQNQLELSKSSFNPELLISLKGQCVELESELKANKDELLMVKAKNKDLIAKQEELTLELKNKKVAERNSSIDLVKDHDSLTYQLQDARKQIDEVKQLYIETSGAKDKITKELNALKSSDVYKQLQNEKIILEDLKLQLGKEKQKVDNLSAHLLNQQISEFNEHLENYKESKRPSESHDKSESLTEKHKDAVNNLEIQKLQNMTKEHVRSVNLLQEELAECKELIVKLRLENELQAKKDVLISDLKEKAKQFEEYIKSGHAKLLDKRDACTSPTKSSDYKEKTEEDIVDLEHKIRLELDKQLTLEIKNLNRQFREKLNIVDKQYNENLLELNNVLKVKTREVATLREVILSERKKLQEASQDKIDLTEQLSAQLECSNELARCKQQISQLKAQLQTGRGDAGAGDLKLMQDKLSSTAEELDKLKVKYKTMKKTALIYKEYMAEKDKHTESEIQRIKQKYEEIKNGMQVKLQEYINQNEKHVKLQLSKIESQYIEKIGHLEKEMIQKVV